MERPLERGAPALAGARSRGRTHARGERRRAARARGPQRTRAATLAGSPRCAPPSRPPAGSAAWNFSALEEIRAPRLRSRPAPTRARTPRRRPGIRARDGVGSAQRGHAAPQPRERTRALRAQPLPGTGHGRPTREAHRAARATARGGEHAGWGSAAPRRSRARRAAKRAGRAGGGSAGRGAFPSVCHPQSCAVASHGSARNRHNPATCSCRNCSEPPVPVDAGWNFAPIVAPRARRPTPRSTSARWRISRAKVGRARHGGGRLALWLTGVALLFVALISPVDRLGEQLATMHMVQHLLLADLVPICLTLALTKHILRLPYAPDPPDRAGGQAVRPSRVRRRSPTSPRCGSGTCQPSTTPRSRPGHLMCSILLKLRRRRTPVLVAPAVADPLADAAQRPSALCSTWLSTKLPRRLPRASCSPSPPRSSTRSTRSTATRWGMSTLDDQHVAGLVMALEQSIIMGHRARLPVRPHARGVRGRGAARRALRGGVGLCAPRAPAGSAHARAASASTITRRAGQRRRRRAASSPSHDDRRRRAPTAASSAISAEPRLGRPEPPVAEREAPERLRLQVGVDRQRQVGDHEHEPGGQVHRAPTARARGRPAPSRRRRPGGRGSSRSAAARRAGRAPACRPASRRTSARRAAPPPSTGGRWPPRTRTRRPRPARARSGDRAARTRAAAARSPRAGAARAARGRTSCRAVRPRRWEAAGSVRAAGRLLGCRAHG